MSRQLHPDLVRLIIAGSVLRRRMVPMTRPLGAATLGMHMQTLIVVLVRHQRPSRQGIQAQNRHNREHHSPAKPPGHEYPSET